MATIKGLGSNLKLQKRLAMSLLNCGRGRAWLNPERTKLIANARSRAEVRSLIQAGVIVKKEKPNQPMDRDEKLKRRFRMRMARRVIEEEGFEV